MNQGSKWLLWFNILLSVTVLVTGIWLNLSTFYLLHGDSLIYINLAKHYLNGRWDIAINAYWSPLLSWLLIPCIVLKLEPVWSIKILSLLAIVCIIFINTRFLRNKMSPILMCASNISTAIILLTPAVTFATPDILVIPIILFCIYYLSELKNYESKYFTIYTGFIGALMYFCKYFGFYYFLSLITAITLLHLLFNKGKRELLLRKYFASLSVFLLLSAPWIIALSLSEKHFIISSSGSFNLALYANPHLNQPEYIGSHLFHLPYPEAIGNWEKPVSYNLAAYSWKNIFSSKEDLAEYYAYLKKNCEEVYHLLSYLVQGFFLYLAILFIVLSILVFRKKRDWLLLTIPAAFLIYAFGYSIISIDHRYLYVLFPLFFTAIFLSFQYVIQFFKKGTLISALILSLALIYIFSSRSIERIHEYIKTGREMKNLVEDIKPNIKPGSTFALYKYFNYPNEVLYATQTHITGELSLDMKQKSLRELIKEYNFNYIFSSERDSTFKDYPLVYKNDKNAIYIYRCQ